MKKILFVCLGNICRSPAAEAIMKKYILEANLSGELSCDSAGILGIHAGGCADARMRAHALQRGITIDSISRQLSTADFRQFDWIIGMDNDNIRAIHKRENDEAITAEILPMARFCLSNTVHEIPDPYYGGSDGFDLVLDLLDGACQELLRYIRTKQ